MLRLDIRLYRDVRYKQNIQKKMWIRKKWSQVNLNQFIKIRKQKKDQMKKK